LVSASSARPKILLWKKCTSFGIPDQANVFKPSRKIQECHRIRIQSVVLQVNLGRLIGHLMDEDTHTAV
jgi:hypothetical protein